MSIELYSHQEEAVRKLHNGSILCGAVGTGKSRTALAYFYLENGGKLHTEKHVRMTDPKDLYIITTARKRDTLEWEEELAHFLMSTDENINSYKNKIVVDSWNNIKKYKDVYGAFFIFDEQRVVGRGAWVKAFLKIARKNKWILLSATPGDTWSDYIPVFIANGYYKNRTEFFEQHVIMNRYSKYPKIDRYVGVGKLIRLRKEILVNMPFKKQAEKHDIVRMVEYDKKLYLTVSKNRWNVYDNEPVKEIGKLCYLMREVVNSDPSRIFEVENILKENKKAIIFYNYDYELNLLREMAKRIGIVKGEWNGKIHEPIPNSDSWIYLVQYTAGAEGWNCTETNVIIFYSQNYSYRMTIQAAGRIDRLNTPYSDLYYYYLKSSAPIDIAISRALHSKKNFNEKAFLEA